MTRSDLSPALAAALDRVLAMEATTEDQALVTHWIGRDPRRSAWLAALRTTIDADPPVAHWDVEAAWGRVVSARRGGRHGGVSWRREMLGVLALAAAASAVLVLRPPARSTRAPMTQAIETPIGATRRVTLVDGSTVVLGPSSAITTVAGAERTVTLRGRATFDVVPDAARPFVVRAGFGEVRVLGTGFEVQAYDDEASARVAVAHGRVAVRAAAMHGDGAVASDALVLSAGEAATIRDGVVTREAATAVTDVGAWREGRLVFRDVPVAVVARELTRWGRPMRVAPTVATRRVTITLRLAALEGAPAQLALALGAVWRDGELSTTGAPSPPGRE